VRAAPDHRPPNRLQAPLVDQDEDDLVRRVRAPEREAAVDGRLLHGARASKRSASSARIAAAEPDREEERREVALLALELALELGDLLVELGAALLELVLGLDDLVLVRGFLLVAKDLGRHHVLSPG
jgi:hypothetical protein